eukprot:TRINITY_DN11621_c0_g1_i3.p1 TRINITY_DN11621_c0_g1~~TRINITY_DN11621_c0_g1_i3.p1  ORF type:complete len:315 (-),score=47.26 TRINITY_DN11621_c0_g1_i3:109-1053(-)
MSEGNAQKSRAQSPKPTVTSGSPAAATEPAKQLVTVGRLAALAAPSALTLAALACSLTAMRVAFSKQWQIAGGLIMVSAFCDALDGHVARLLDSVTVFGAELDSLGDLVNFGVAPAIVMYAWADEGTGDSWDIFLWVCCVLFCQACALRLARFNCSPGGPAHVGSRPSESKPSAPEGQASQSVKFVARTKFFNGVPAPMGALLALLPLSWHLEVGYVPFGWRPRQVACPVLFFSALLMVSNLKTLSSKMLVRDPKKASHLRIRSSWEAMLKTTGVLVAVATSMLFSPWRLILLMELVYVASLFVGPIVYFYFAD